MSSRLTTSLFFILGLSMCFVASASTHTDGTRDFRYGVQAFQQGNLTLAKQLLESAQSKGIESLSLSYNLGVVYYRLAEYARSRQAFSKILGTKQSSLAHYNLGLVALAEDDATTARDHFKVVASNSGQPKLAKLAYAQLQKLGSTPLLPKQWQAFLSLATGYEDNLGLFPDTAASTLEDGFLESIGAASGYAYQKGKNAIKWKAQFYTRDYFEEDDFNTQLLRLGTAWHHDRGRNRISFGLEGDQLWLADSSREQRARLVAGWVTPACATTSLSARCQIKLEAEQIFADKERFEAYEGQHYRLDTRYRARYGNWSGEAQYRFDLNDRKNRDIGDEFFSVSPIMHTVGFKLSYAITRAFTLGTDASFRQSDYTLAHRLKNEKTTKRSDQRLSYHLNARYQVDQTFAITTKLGRLSNESNIDRYQYDRETVTLGVNIRL